LITSMSSLKGCVKAPELTEEVSSEHLSLADPWSKVPWPGTLYK